MPKWFLLTLGMMALLTPLRAEKDAPQLPPFRLVWAQDQGDQRDVFGVGKQSILKKYDSTLGEEEVLLGEQSSYGNPMLCSNGDWVVYSDRYLNQIFKIPFAGGEPALVAEGFGAELWRDPQTGDDMLFIATDPEGVPQLPAWGRIDKKNLHGKEPPEPFWQATRMMANNFQLSADGKVASGQFPWPIGGIAAPETQQWFPLDRGCWPSLAPDNSYLFWQFDGPHRNVIMQDPVNRKSWQINLSQASGIHGMEVYHPRWSNHPLHFVFTGPYVEGTGGNRISGGGAAVEIYLGTFSDDLSKLVRTRKITENQKADFFPDLWIKDGEKIVSTRPQRNGFRAEIKADYSLYFGWEHAAADNRAADGKTTHQINLFDAAYLGPHHEIVLRGPGAHANPMINHFPFVRLVQRTKAWTFESVFTSLKDSQRGRMFGFTQHSRHVNVFLDQIDDQVLLTLNIVGDPVQIWLGRIEKKVPLHLIVSVKGKRVRAWANGRLIEEEVPGDTFWGNGSMIWGEKVGYGFPWKGTVSHIRILSRPLQIDEGEARAEAVAADLKHRVVLPQVRVKARLLEVSSISDPKRISPYKNELTAGEYEVVDVQSGTFPHRKFAGYAFGILNERINDKAPRKTGEVYELVLEPFNKQPQLRAELQSNDLDNLDLPEFLILP